MTDESDSRIEFPYKTAIKALLAIGPEGHAGAALSPIDRIVYVALATRATRHGIFEPDTEAPSVKRELADAAGISVRALTRSLHTLQSVGLITITRRVDRHGGHAPSSYRLFIAGA